MAGPIRRASDRRQAHRPPDPEMAEGGRPGRRDSRPWSEKGTGQGAVISPLLANVYLHYVFDLWAHRWRRREAQRRRDHRTVRGRHRRRLSIRERRRGVLGRDARTVAGVFAVAASRTRRVSSSSAALRRRPRARRGQGKPETFNFLGFTFICGKTRAGQIPRHEEVARRPHESQAQGNQRGTAEDDASADPEQGKWLWQVLSGWLAYHAVPTNFRALQAFRDHVTKRWRRSLSRRSQRGGITWERMRKIADGMAPRPAYPSSMASDALRRQTPKVGAVCGNSASTDLCGGRSAMSVPTANARRAAATKPACTRAMSVSVISRGTRGYSCTPTQG